MTQPATSASTYAETAGTLDTTGVSSAGWSTVADDPDGWLFPNTRSASGHIEDMKTAFRRCVVRAGLDPRDVIPHTMRHTAITNLAATGADIPTIQAFSGHLSLKMVMRYAHARDRRVDEAVDRMEKAKTKIEQFAPSKTRNS